VRDLARSVSFIQETVHNIYLRGLLFLCLSCVVLFGLMATKLNKHYYYYYYYYYLTVD